jgi:hypothetical protein
MEGEQMTRNEAINRLITMKCYKADHTSDIVALDMAIAALRDKPSPPAPGPSNWRGEEAVL